MKKRNKCIICDDIIAEGETLCENCKILEQHCSDSKSSRRDDTFKYYHNDEDEDYRDESYQEKIKADNFYEEQREIEENIQEQIDEAYELQIMEELENSYYDGEEYWH